MVLNPDVQKRAQEEIDRVVGPDRLVGISDRPDLPYLCALVKEVMRWHVLAPLSTSASCPAFTRYNAPQVFFVERRSTTSTGVSYLDQWHRRGLRARC